MVMLELIIMFKIVITLLMIKKKIVMMILIIKNINDPWLNA